MARAGEGDREEILEVLKKMSGENRKGANQPKNPSSAVTTLGSNVSLVRTVAVPPIIVFILGGEAGHRRGI